MPGQILRFSLRKSVAVTFAVFVLVSSASVILSPQSASLRFVVAASEVHGPIEIVGDAEFAALAMAEGWPGSGTPSDPYLIIDLEISATVPYAVSITDTTASFALSGCTLSGTSASVHLQNVQNGLIDGNELLGVNYGVILSESDDITVSNNTCDTSGASLALFDSDNCILADNALSSSLRVGIEIHNSIGATLRSNVMTGCGLILHPWHEEHATTHNIGIDNTVDGRPVYYLSGQEGAVIPDDAGQVILADCSNMIVEGLVLPGVAVGVMLYFSSNITIADVESERNFWCGVNAEYCDGVLIEGCSLSGNHNNGLRIAWCEDTEVRGCDVSGNHMGLIVSFCVDTQLVENLCGGNDCGLFMTDSTNCTLTSNTFLEDDITIQGYHLNHWNSHSMDMSNTVNGKPVVYVSDQVGGSVPDGAGELILANCSDLEIADHTFDSDLQTAVLMGLCENVTFSGCAFEDNSIGIYMQWSEGNNVSDCEFLRSGLGIFAQYCTHNTFSNNTFEDGSIGMDIDADSNYNEIYLNGFLDQLGYAVKVERQSTGNMIHSNTFTDNNGATAVYSQSRAQCYDDCVGNLWSVNGYGNFWSDWTSPDEDDDGIVDVPYQLAPDGAAYDPFPLVVPPNSVPGGEPQQVRMMMQMGRTAFKAGEPVTFEAELVNEGSAPVELTFPNSQVVDFRIEDSGGAIVFDYSPVVLWWPATLVLEPGEVYSEEHAWDQDEGELGSYTILTSLNWYEGEALAAEATIMIDGNTPVTEASILGVEGDSGWYVSEVTLSLNATDDSSGVALIEYKVDESEWSVYSGHLELSNEGIHRLEYRSEDNAGNVEPTRLVTVKVDCTIPVLNIDLEGDAVLDADTVTISLDCSDSCSGVAGAEYSLDGADFIPCGTNCSLELKDLSEGNHTITVRATDIAGNTAEEVVVFATIQEDEEKPISLLTVGLVVSAAAAILAAIVILLRRTKPT